MGLHHANAVIIIHDKAGQPVAFAVDQAVAVGGTVPASKSSGKPDPEGTGNHILPIMRTEHILAGETQHPHCNRTYLVMTVG